MFGQPLMNALGDKAHDAQMLDHQVLLFGGERTTGLRGENIPRRIAQPLGLRSAVHLGLDGRNVWEWANDRPEWLWDSRYFPQSLPPAVRPSDKPDHGSTHGARTFGRPFRGDFVRPARFQHGVARSKHPDPYGERLLTRSRLPPPRRRCAWPKQLMTMRDSSANL
jgi:hypothetical protein